MRSPSAPAQRFLLRCKPVAELKGPLSSLVLDESLRESLRANLEAFDRRTQGDDSLIPAAVAIVIVADQQGRPCFLLTRRAATLRRHRKQWALPGGRVDAGELVVEAALRELHEELGLELGEPSILGLLDDFPTRSGFVITPVVVWGGGVPGPSALTPNPAEVESVHWVPLAELEHPSVPILHEIPESERPVISLPLMGNKLVHAPTAALLFQLREVALRGLATRVDHFEQPVFAWK